MGLVSKDREGYKTSLARPLGQVEVDGKCAKPLLVLGRGIRLRWSRIPGSLLAPRRVAAGWERLSHDLSLLLPLLITITNYYVGASAQTKTRLGASAPSRAGVDAFSFGRLVKDSEYIYIYIYITYIHIHTYIYIYIIVCFIISITSMGPRP